ncbi:MAG: hypothetical protein AN484_23145 [Aphanizomenon flos-aquae WA102]|jgi:hypothetical protein|uniref:Uncharacterized protein n=1 Tax=Aphanizomenon flos-aquae WA102 TaxID=1710896 RepID=A0A1B7WRJ4_APHFL|nr:MAG: hypothetical protein AN484_23145 [Aphanizomenon flos-aquae WA102]
MSKIYNKLVLFIRVTYNENGFIANNLREFAEYSLQLWQDQNPCKRLGVDARNSISKEFSRDRLLKDL